MNATRFLLRTALYDLLSLSVLPGAKAQCAYAFYPNNSTINSAVNTTMRL